MDKWLWAVRLYKTRTLAAAACTQGRVTIGGSLVKPARAVRVGDAISAFAGDVHRTVQVLRLIDRRISASQVGDFLTDLTPAAEYERAREARRQFGFIPRSPGTGRPTKKDRRSLDRLQSPE
jgi:ribosome-associated heat shock protein Hsp15